MGRDSAGHHMTDRAFGLTLSVLCAIFGLGPLLFSKPMRPPFVVAGVVLISIAGTYPVLLHWPKTGWLAVTSRIAKVVNVLLFGVIFYVVVTPVGIFFRLIGRDVLNRKWDKNLPSYWTERPADKTTDMHHQF